MKTMAARGAAAAMTMNTIFGVVSVRANAPLRGSGGELTMRVSWGRKGSGGSRQAAVGGDHVSGVSRERR
ncbi:hypothetical protein GCM10010300_52100 [Streptomyces olivaceoviridis]|nr:hypothetical protein GCM10010300_52100 [Streptomyces olivaceoviridis]